MASKVAVPETWLKIRPNLKNVPHLYTVDQSVGINGVNRSDDVALIQFMLLKWEYAPTSGLILAPETKSWYGDVPVTGKWDMRTLGFILIFQMKNPEYMPVNGMFDPINLKQPPGPSTSMLYLNGVLLADVPQIFKDLSKAPGIPAQLIQALK
jgi:hypothetical protein